MSAIFCHDDEQLSLAECSKDEQQKKTSKQIFTKIVMAEKFYDAEDYHQKYMLRSHRTLLQSLRLSEREILKSHIAAKLNGYVGGFGNLSDFEKDKTYLGLNPQQTDYVVRQISERRGH